MRKSLLIAVFFGLSFYLISGTAHIEFQVDFPTPKIEVWGNYHKVVIPGLPNYGGVGKPCLPVKTCKVYIPPGKKVSGVRIQPLESKVLPGKYRIKPGGRFYPLISYPLKFTPSQPDPSVYSLRSLYPASPFKQMREMRFRGYSILPLVIYPLRYIPQEGKLIFYPRIKVEVFLEDETLRVRSLYRALPRDREILRKEVVNPQDIKSFPAPLSFKTSNLTGGPYDYVIITSSDLAKDFEPLRTHKEKRGLKACIITLDFIEANYEGRDLQEKIRNFIKDAYLTWHIDYVLLGGDTEVVPYRGVYGSCEGEVDEDIPCDLYYACLDGDWDADGDNVFGEPEDEVDLIAEVYVGRAPVETPQEVENFCNKVIWYENSFSASYHKKFLLVGEKLSDDPPVWGGDFKDLIEALIPPQYEVSKRYDKLGNFNGNGEYIIQAINEGTHLINHIGHADYWMVMWIGDWEFYDISGDPADIQNDENFCFIYSQGCYAGAFDRGGFPGGTDECVGENFLRSQYGAFGVIMNSRYGWYDPEDIENSPSQVFDREFWDAVFNPQPLTTPSGLIRAILREIPALSTTSTTSLTSL